MTKNKANIMQILNQPQQPNDADLFRSISRISELADALDNMSILMKKISENEEVYRFMACHDALTGVFNRLHLMATGERLLEESMEVSEPLGLVMADMDKLKRINDKYGHQAGDAALRHAVGLLKDSVRDGDSIYRYGGEEFVIVLQGASLGRVAIITERMRSALESTPLAWEEETISVTASFGASVIEHSSGKSCSLGQLIKSADANLYVAKKSRNTVVCGLFSPVQSKQRRSADSKALSL